MKEYQTQYFKDTNGDRKRLSDYLNEQARLGWKLSSQQVISQGYSPIKTAFLGFLFLPLALLGKKSNVIEVVLERNVKKGSYASKQQCDNTFDSVKDKLPFQTSLSSNNIKKRILIFVGLFLAFCVLVGIIEAVSSPNQSQTSNAVVTKPKAAPTESPELKKYKAEINPLIDQFNSEAKLIASDKSNLPYASDPVYINADKVFHELDNKMNYKVNYVPADYTGHHTLLDWITTIMADSIDARINTPQGQNVVGWAAIGIGTAEHDMKIAQQFKKTYPCDYVDDTYSGYACLIDKLQNIGTGNLQ